ncbi:nif-specific transcriptional activator NifA [Aquabacterium sp. CECT 9606]|uniref:nif-specific transcriptional activator NifA n=1 Tax=Aquabacterium sp. CECT 9606 TaxID=2845822 RepID=UPI001E3A194B|nr:nif-specific transcriptional activator NifA [Aquabacterium sp. CECT 9606]CAH0350308.1 Nif-specific regulatory protein [Aquabacterium sp. CECT 9606]
MVTTHHERASIELLTVYQVSKILGSSLDIFKTFREALNVMVSMMGWRRAIVNLQTEDGSLQGMCAVGLSREESAKLVFAVGEGIVGRVFASGLPMVVPDIQAEPLFLNRSGAADQSPNDPIAYIATPIKADRRTLGVLTMDRLVTDRSGVFDEDLRLLSMVATLMGQNLLLHRSVSAEQGRLYEESRRLSKAIKPVYKLETAIGGSPRMQEVFAEVHQAAPTKTTVLLRGESGTGKEVVARAVHNLSPRKDEPFVRVNCAALTESLLESELFGHEKGAFTGAMNTRKGRFEMAHGGTLFLDEIGDISAGFQAKLLRVLQEREFERVGGTTSIRVDVRMVLATNRNLEKMVAAGEFRADLYYRINVVSIFLPPLRERREDIPLMVEHFLARFNRENNRKVKVTPRAMKVLSSCYWPGNVRELENCVERTATMAQNEDLTDLSFPCHDNRCLTQVLHHVDREDAVKPGRPIGIPITEVPLRPAMPAKPADHHEGDDDHSLAATSSSSDDKPDGERERLIWAMEKCGWVQAKAARLLNITPRQMGYALQKHDIEVRKF